MARGCIERAMEEAEARERERRAALAAQRRESREALLKQRNEEVAALLAGCAAGLSGSHSLVMQARRAGQPSVHPCRHNAG